jgi:hypothetical protein
MPKMTFNTIVADSSSGKKLGSRHEKLLSSLFATSPLLNAGKATVEGQPDIILTPEKLKEWYYDNVVNGVVPQSAKYYSFSQDTSTDFLGAPDLNTVATGGGGLPSTPYVPNVASPGADSAGDAVNVDASKIPDSKDFASLMNSKLPTTFGSGASANQSSRNPSVSSKVMKGSAEGSTLGSSPATSAKL